MMKHFLNIFLLVLSVCGCQTVDRGTTAYPPSASNISGSKTEEEASLKAVAESVVGRELTDQDMNNLKKDVFFDKETRSAVEAIADSLSQPVRVKYCPVCGKRYAPTLTECPEHHVELKWVEE